MTRQMVYEFEFEDGKFWNYAMDFDDRNLLISKDSTEIKEWTRLSCHQCSNCPLSEDQVAQCPVAKNLDIVVEDSKDTASYLQARVSVYTPERTYLRSCAVQEGLRSLFGIIMACSGCPQLDWLRPLARFHLPFADFDETLFRALSLQLLYQFFDENETELTSCAKILQERYKVLQLVNQYLIKRIKIYCEADAGKNAITALNVYAQMFPFQLQTHFSSLKKYFD